jgi:uncharacterized surface protein with fasciclin (FAS1) repeats
MNCSCKFWIAALVAVFGAGTNLVALAADHAEKTEAAQHDIVDTAASVKDFSTLVTAVKAADLVDALKGEGPFTVFAPTNEAFAKIPKSQLEALLKDKAALTQVLTYHVVPGKVMAADVVKLSQADTLQGEPVKIAVEDGKVMINGAEVIKTDVECTNGVIHVIDTVLMPPR